jgi:hypothetical protein
METKNLKEKYLEFFSSPKEKLFFLSVNDEYEEAPVSFYEFCLSADYLDLSDVIYESVLNAGASIFEKNVLEVVVLAGIGGGKSFLAQLIMAYMAHLILCLKQPQKFFGLSDDKPIVLMNMGLSATQAKRVVFAGIKTLVQNSKWFSAKIKNAKRDVLTAQIVFKRGNFPRERDVLTIECGNSSETTPIGMNLILLVLDEASFYLSNDDKDQAQAIYDTAKARIQSRFGGSAGMLVLISSPRYEKDFMSKKYEEGLNFPDVVFALKNPTWKMKDRDRLSEDVFVFDTISLKILDEKELEEAGIEITDEMIDSLAFGDDVLDKQYWIIPFDYYDSFRRNPEKAKRDLGATPTDSIEAFIKLRDFIGIGCSYENRVGENGVWDTSNPPHETVFIHIDLALNKNSKGEERGDCAGIAVCRCVGFDQKNENRPIIKFDFVEQIRAIEGGEIKFSDVRAKVLALKEAGWKIGIVSLDGWQSFDTMQILKARGIRSGYLSVDTSPEPYESLKDGLYDKRVMLPNMEVLKTELRELERTKRGKIDHPPHGSKDVSDSCAGAMFSCIKNTGIKTEKQMNVINFRG